MAEAQKENFQNIDAVEFKEFINGSHTANGSHGLFKFGAEQGEFTFAIPSTALPKMMASISNVSTKVSQLQSGVKNQKLAFPCTIWDFEGEPQGDKVNMTFKMPGGMDMTFQLSKKQIPLMIDALKAAESGQSDIMLGGLID